MFVYQWLLSTIAEVLSFQMCIISLLSAILIQEEGQEERTKKKSLYS